MGAYQPYHEGLVHRPEHGLIVEAIPATEWERYAQAGSTGS